ncbi:MAG: hypothetical protein HC801_04900 [Nitrospira sp.]|nr:hypothetical protein [Nitrospira sp.]
MKYVEVVADASSTRTISAIAEQNNVFDCRLGPVGEDKQQLIRLLVADDKIQPVLDALQSILGAQPFARIVSLPVEIVLPKPTEEARKKEVAASAAREALYEEVVRNARLDMNFVVLVVLSTAVAAIGLIENNVAVVIGAMVIAPLLGPNLAFNLGTALGDIFSIYGQEAYRRFERRALEQVLKANRRAIIATGGSIVTAPPVPMPAVLAKMPTVSGTCMPPVPGRVTPMPSIARFPLTVARMSPPLPVPVARDWIELRPLRLSCPASMWMAPPVPPLFTVVMMLPARMLRTSPASMWMSPPRPALRIELTPSPATS